MADVYTNLSLEEAEELLNQLIEENAKNVEISNVQTTQNEDGTINITVEK